jgi:hypothetical protein
VLHGGAAALRGVAFFCANTEGCQANANRQDSSKNRSCNPEIRRNDIIERIKDIQLYAPEYGGRDSRKIPVCAVCSALEGHGCCERRPIHISRRLEFRINASNSNFTVGHADVNSLILCAMEIRASQQIAAVLGAVG